MGSHTSWCLQSYCHFQRWCSFLQQVSFVHHSEPPKTGCVSVCNDRMCMCAFVCVCVCLCVCMYVCVFNTCSQYFLYYSAGQKHLLWLILRSHVVMHQLWFIKWLCAESSSELSSTLSNSHFQVCGRLHVCMRCTRHDAVMYEQKLVLLLPLNHHKGSLRNDNCFVFCRLMLCLTLFTNTFWLVLQVY